MHARPPWFTVTRTGRLYTIWRSTDGRPGELSSATGTARGACWSGASMGLNFAVCRDERGVRLLRVDQTGLPEWNLNCESGAVTSSASASASAGIRAAQSRSTFSARRRYKPMCRASDLASDE
jgi:hypothetical protein